MRFASVAMAAIPVLLGGLGIVALSGDFERLSLFSTTAGEPLSTTAEDDPEAGFGSGDVTMDGLTGTAIDGRRPHLTVMEGHGNVVVSALIPALLPLLPAAAMDLSPLPLTEIGDGPGWSPLTSLLPKPNPSPAGQPPAQISRPPLANVPSAVNSPSPLVVPDTRKAPPVIVDVPDVDRDLLSPATADNSGSPDRDRPDLPSQAAGNPPPHAGEQGPPPHAGVPGPPPHATDNGKGNGKDNGNGNGNGNGRPGARGLVDTGQGTDLMTGIPVKAGAPGPPPHAENKANRGDRGPATIVKSTPADVTGDDAGTVRFSATKADTTADGPDDVDPSADPSAEADTDTEPTLDSADSGTGYPDER